MRRPALALLLAALAAFGTAGPAAAQSQRTAGDIPRMVSLRANEVNVRSGPGVRYPVQWVFERKLMPVEVIAEYDTWRKIRDWEGSEGWVHRAMLSSQRTAIVVEEELTLRRQDNNDSPAVARLGQGMVARLEECGKVWCLVSTKGYDGWVFREGLWGLYPGEKLQ